MKESKLSRYERVLSLMESTGWRHVFADEYLLQREYHGHDHEQAFINASRNTNMFERDV